MSYVKPQLLVREQFAASPAAAAPLQRTLYVGGHAKLVRYGVAAERADGRLGAYDPLAAATFAWPNKPAGAVVDAGYARLTAANAHLKYCALTSGNVTVDRSGGKPNRLTVDRQIAAGADGSSPAAAFGDRGAAVGDAVRLQQGSTVFWSTVSALRGAAVAAVVGSAAADPTNPASSVAAAVVTQTAGGVNCLTATSSAASYSALASGRVTDTYTVVVTTGSTGGDLTTARLSVTSAGGDSATNVAPAAAASPFAVGTRGLTMTFAVANHSGTCDEDAATAGIAADDLVAGQTWSIAVTAPYTPSVATSGGTYAGTAAATLTLRVVRGGTFAGSAKPLVQVGTAAGGETGSPVLFSAAATQTAVGGLGVTVAFSGTGLRLGDRYTIPLTPAGEGVPTRVDLADSLPSGWADTTGVAADFFLVKPDVAVPAGLTTWSADADGIDTVAGLTVAVPEWTVAGAVTPLPLWGDPTKPAASVLYATARYWRADLVGGITGATAADRSTTVPGALDPDNPLTYAAHLGLANGAGTALVTAVADPASPASWAAAFEAAFAADEPYNVVPLSADPTVWDLGHAHVTAASAADRMQWRRLWVGVDRIPVLPVVHGPTGVPGHTAASTSDGAVPLATVTDDPGVAGTQYTRVQFTATTNLVTAGVKAGDTVRLNYRDLGAGLVWDEYAVATVRTATELLLAAGPALPVGAAQRAEVWRALAAPAEALAVGAACAAFNDRRVTAVAGEFEAGGAKVPSHFAAAAVAGLAAGVLPHQGLTQVSVTGVAPTAAFGKRFSDTDLDVMAGRGAWLVVRDRSGAVYTRHAVTTAPTDLASEREEVRSRNFDNVCARIKTLLAPYIGRANVTPTVQRKITLDLFNLGLVLGNEATGNADLGPQVNSFADITLTTSDLSPDRYALTMTVDLPYPLNVLDATVTLTV